MQHSKWRRFLPRHTNYPEREVADVFFKAKQVVGSMRIKDVKMASDAHKLLRKKENPSLTDRLVLITLATPRAAQAQLEMDTHQGGYRNHKARLFELIEFNDTFVDTVLAFPENQLPGFTDRLHALMNSFCSDINALMFTDEQYEAIVHGLSREIAVYKAIQSEEDMSAQMTSRVQDAHGVDIIVRDSHGRSMGIDCKTRSSFHFRLIDLKRKGVITEEERLTAELRGYAVLTKGKRDDFVQTTLLRVATQDLGEIQHFVFEDTKRVVQHIRNALAAQPLGKSALQAW